MKRSLIAGVLCLLLAVGPATAQSQQAPYLPELLSRSEQFNKLYSQKRLAGANLAAIDPLRQQSEAAFRAGNVRGMLEVVGHEIALLEGKQWDEKERFLASLTLEPDRLVLEPNQDLQVSLIRMFPTNIDQALTPAPTVTFEIKPDESATSDAARPLETPVALRPTAPVIIGERLAISQESTIATRRLRLPDGVYWVLARIESGGQPVAQLSRPIYAINDFTDRVSRLSSLAAVIRNSADPKVKAVAIQGATPEFQLQRLAGLNSARSDYEINAIAELDRIESLLSSLAKGLNPLTPERGELERAYRAADGKLMPYRVYVPINYDGASARPLVVLLHGALGDERSYFSGLYDPAVIKGESERRGMILAAVSGGDRFAPYQGTGQNDVFEVVQAISRDYKIDPARVYLSGHSIGATGAWAIASTRPEVFAAIAPVSGGAPVQADALGALLGRLKGTPALIIHGAKDGIAPVENSRKVFAAAQKAGLKVEYIEMPDADHTTVVGATFPAVMQFFERNSKKPAAK
jgi:predicted esterase